MRIFLLLAFLTFGSVANEHFSFDASILDETRFIYWVNHETKQAIVYGKHENFHKLKKLVSHTLLTSTGKVLKSKESCSYDKLIFVNNEQGIVAQLYITDKNLTYNNYVHTPSNSKLSDVIEINDYRIKSESLVDSRTINHNIKNYSEKCL